MASRLPEDGWAALLSGLKLRCSVPSSWLIVAALGSQKQDEMLRLALAHGADEAVRLWEPDIQSLGEAARALLVAAIAQAMNCDLVALGLTNRRGDLSPLAALVAEELSVPYVHGVEYVNIDEMGEVVAGRLLEGGFREEVAMSPPVVLSLRSGMSVRQDHLVPPLATLLAAEAARVSVLELAGLGVPASLIRERESRLVAGRFVAARPALLPNPAPDSCLPASDRIQALVGGTVRSRAGRVMRGTPKELAESLGARLREGGWLDARPD